MARDAPTIFIAALRLVALVLGWYLAATLVLGVASRLTRIAGAVRMTDAISLPWVRSVVSASARLLLVAAPLAIPRTVPAGATNPPAATRPHEDVPLLRRLAQPTDDDPPLLRRLSDDPTPTTGPPSPATWTVRPGESFWSIASSTMTSALHHPPKVVELTPYWERLIAVNRAKLADPANPDLLYPGQVLDLPPTPTAQPP
jgi:nucleoid-associated protein YgaU